MFYLDRIYQIFFENIVENLTEDDTISIIYLKWEMENIYNFFGKTLP